MAPRVRQPRKGRRSQSASACTEDGKLPPDRNWSIRLHSHHPRHATISLCMDRLNRSQVEIKTTDTPGPVSSHSTLPAKRILSALRLRPAAEKFKKCNGFGFSGATTGRSCCVCHRAVGLFRACCRSVIVVFLTCFSRVPDSASEAVKPLNHHNKSMTPGPGWPKRHQKNRDNT